MPFLQDDSEELKKQQEAQSGQAISGQSTIVAPGTAPAVGSPKSSGSFTNLNTYLEANKPNTAEMANKITSGVDTAAQEATNKATDFGKSFDASTVKSTSEEYLGKSFYNDPGAANKEEYNKLKSGYQGPQSVEQQTGYNEAQSASQTAQRKVGALGGDIGTLARETFDKSPYSAGANKLDTALLGRDTGAKAQIAQTGEKWKGINDLMSGVTNTAAQKIASNKSAGQANQALIAQQEQAQQQNLLSPIQQRVQSANTQANALQNDLADGKVDDPNTWAFLGISGPAAGGGNISDYWTPGTGQANLGNTAMDAERAKYNALQSLIGGTGTELNPTEAYTPGLFNKDKYLADAAATSAQFASAKNTSPMGTAPSPYQDVLTQGGATATDMANLSDAEFLAKYGMTKAGYNEPVQTNKSLR